MWLLIHAPAPTTNELNTHHSEGMGDYVSHDLCVSNTLGQNGFN